MQLSLLAALPLAIGITSAYTMHPMLLQAVQQMGCTLPDKFHVKDFIGQTNGTVADAPAPSFFTFSYEDPATEVTTFCQFNATSTPITSKGPAPRFPCENRNVEFIWQNGLLTLVERACPSPGQPALYEASGSINISAPCTAGRCTANSTDYVGTFVSLEPVPAANSHQMAYEMMQLE